MAQELIYSQQNTGLITEVSGNIWLGGDIPYQVILSSGDWRPYAVTHEKQRNPLETMACVSFSLNNNLEIQHNFKGIDINLSDRFLAKISDTQKNGNTFEKVADACRKIGSVSEETWPNSSFTTWDEYYAPIPQNVLSQARIIDFSYGIIPASNNKEETLKYHLKQSPLWITIPNPYPNHAVTLLYVNSGLGYVQDHYDRQIRTVKVSDIAVAFKVIINKYLGEDDMVNQTKIVLSKDGKTVYKAVPIATDFDNFKKQASVEGIEVPNPIPPASEL